MFTGWVRTMFTFQLIVYTTAISSVNKIVITEWLRLNISGFLMYIVNKPILVTCADVVRRRGSSNHQFWWEQSMDLEAVRAARIAGPTVVSDDEEENC